MIDINIHVDLTLKEETIQFLGQLLGTKTERTVTVCAPAPERPKLETKEEPEPKPELELEKKPEKLASTEQPEDITDEQLGEAVVKAKDAVGPKDVRTLFSKFNIGCSSDCPQDKRRALLDELTKLAS